MVLLAGEEPIKTHFFLLLLFFKLLADRVLWIRMIKWNKNENKNEDVEGFFEEEQNAMFLTFQQMLTPFGR